MSAVSSLSEIQQTLATQPTQQDFGALQQSLRTGLTEAVRSLKKDLPTAPIPAITTTLNTMFHNFTGHILNHTATMLKGAVVAITKGEIYTPPTFTTVTRPSPSSTAAVPSRPTAPTAPTPSSAPSIADPAVDPAEDLSQKVSLQMQKEELIKAGYDKDYVKDLNEESIAALMAKDAEQQTLTEQQSEDAYLIRSWLWVPKERMHYVRIEFEDKVWTKTFKSMKEIYAEPLPFLQKLRKVKCINDENQREEGSATMTLNAYIESQLKEKKKGKGKAS